MADPWEVQIHRAVAQVVYLLPKEIAQPIRNTIARLAQNPDIEGRRLVGGFPDVFQVVVAKHDIMFQIREEPEKIVRVVKVQLHQ
jgi:mRNA-degrading endonuclease RelE of RelBE toxin-antitoxin system